MLKTVNHGQWLTKVAAEEAIAPRKKTLVPPARHFAASFGSPRLPSTCMTVVTVSTGTRAVRIAAAEKDIRTLELNIVRNVFDF